MPATYEPIATTTVSGTSTFSITFSSISNTYTDLKLIVSALANNTGPLVMRFNSDSGTNYSVSRITALGTTPTMGGGTNDDYIYIAGAMDVKSTTIPMFYQIDIFNYSGSTAKTICAQTAADQNGNASYGVGLDVGLWRSTSVINSIFLQLGTGNVAFTAGSTATLYGIKRA